MLYIRTLSSSLLSDFRPAAYAYLIVFVPSTILLLATSSNSSLELILSESRQTPWGIITSMFVHSGVPHYADNMGSLIIFVLMFAAVNQCYPTIIKHRRSLFFFWNIFFSAIAANIAYFVLSSEITVGGSGIVFGAEGVTLGFALSNLVPPQFSFGSMRGHLFGKSNRRTTPCSVVVFTVFFGLFLLAPAQFLVYGPGFNVFVHFLGFYVGFASGLSNGLLSSRVV